LFPPTSGVAVNIVCGELDPKIRQIQPDSHRKRDALARGKIPCEAKAREANQIIVQVEGSRSRYQDVLTLSAWNPALEEECWRAPPHIGQELCEDYVVDLIFQH
jgi:hypothetical protein